MTYQHRLNDGLNSVMLEHVFNQIRHRLQIAGTLRTCDLLDLCKYNTYSEATIKRCLTFITKQLVNAGKLQQIKMRGSYYILDHASIELKDVGIYYKKGYNNPIIPLPKPKEPDYSFLNPPPVACPAPAIYEQLKKEKPKDYTARAIELCMMHGISIGKFVNYVKNKKNENTSTNGQTS